MSFENTFDRCHRDVDNAEILTCSNFLNDQASFLVEDNGDYVANCAYHQCVVMRDAYSLDKNVLSCSGLVFEFDASSSSMFVPLTSNVFLKENAIALPQRLLDQLSSRFSYYYVKDVRTVFSQNISKVVCDDGFKTSITLEDGSVIHWGNLEDEPILHGLESFLVGLSVAFGCLLISHFILIYFVESQYSYRFKFLVKAIFGGILSAILLLFLSALVVLMEPTSLSIGVLLVYILFSVGSLVHALYVSD